MNATQHDATGFNLEFGKTWIYPTNLSIRKYQKDIVQEALFRNTMVCLPTGLGKTFIAAVVMYNYYRWFPSGKIIFMATTKPLVKQQVDACYKIVAIPKESTAELTGSVLKQNRQSIWKDKRVFFLTPQVLRNDLETIEDLGSKIKCIVVDEAHRARGNHAYCEVINKLQELNKEFRVLALTATPASNLVDVISVCQQLLISHLEVRTEDSPDVLPYSHKKSMETIVLKLDGKLGEVNNEYKKILDKYVRILVEHKVIDSNFSNLHKGRLFYISKEYQEKNIHNRSTEKYKLVTKVLHICTILYHAYDLLIRHGLRCFLKYFEENVNKPLLVSSSTEILKLLESIKEYVGPPLICDKLPDGSHLKLPEECKFGHPKFYKLREILGGHFASHDVNSKVIIFCEYKDSVAEAYAALLDQKSVKPKMFMGQSSITQKQQVNIIDSFRNGSFNTLISTCIGEEGIDVGFVDMVVCFDISNKSSVRFIQRIGRTGRDRNGRVVILVSEGREQQVLKECLQEKKHLSSTLVHARNIDDKLYKNDPRMIPEGLTPECQELHIAPKKPMKLTNFFTSTAASSSILETSRSDSSKFNSTLTTVSNFIPNTKFLVLDENNDDDCFKFKFNQHLDLQRSAQSVNIPTSSKTELFIDLMKQIEYARFDIKSKTTDSQLLGGNAKKSSRIAAKKQTDIRNMFKQCSQVSKTISEDKVIGIETLLESKIANILASSPDCGVCNQFENDLNIKRDLIPIGNLNLKIGLKFSLTTICSLQNKINQRLNKGENVLEKKLQNDMNDDTFTHLIEEYTKSSKQIVEKQLSFSDILEESPVRNQEQRKLGEPLNVSKSKLESPDLFDEEFPVFSPSNRQKRMSNEMISSETKIKMQNIFPEVVAIAEDDIIEASPSPLINKRKAESQSSFGAMRAKKRIKFDFTDIFDAASVTNMISVKTPTATRLSKKKIIASDLLDMNLIEKSVAQEKTPTNSQSSDISNKSDKSETSKRTKKIEASDLFDFDSMQIPKKRTVKKIQADDLFDFDFDFNLPPKKTTSEAASEKTNASSPDLSSYQTSFIAPVAPTKPIRARVKKQLTCVDISDASMLMKTTKVNLSVLKSPPPVVPSQSVELQSSASSVSLSSVESVNLNQRVTKRKGPKRARHFIDSEAEVSSDEVHSADENISSQDDVYDASFVDDDVDDNAAIPNTQTHAMYLQSVKSPVIRGRVLRRPVTRHVDDTIMHETVDMTYAKDSFCVDDIDASESPESMDELEKAELELKRRRKNKGKVDVAVEKITRKRIRRIASDSD